MARDRILPALVAVAALVGPAASSRADGEWTTETVETGVLAPGVSLALDAAGAPRMAYNSGAQPHYAWRHPGGWSVEGLATPPSITTVAPVPSGQTAGAQLIYYVVPSLAIDPGTALPRIAYGKSPENDVWYAVRSASEWSYQFLSGVAENPTLALDSHGRAHVAYRDLFYGVEYAGQNANGTWTVDGIEEGGDPRTVRVDTQDRPHIAMNLASPNSDLLYASRDAGSWTVEAVDTLGNVGYSASLALDGTGDPHIAFIDATAHALRYATRSGGVWSVETVAAPVGDWCSNSLAVAPGGQPFIAFHDAVAGDLRFARREGGIWSSEVVDSAGNVGDHCSLALDGEGRPHIGYYDASNYRVRYTTRSAVVGVTPPPAEPRSGIARLSPNPVRAGRAFELALRLETPCVIGAELIDLAGRRVAAREAEAFTPGVHALRWDPGFRRPGLFFVRIRSDRGATFVARLVVLE